MRRVRTLKKDDESKVISLLGELTKNPINFQIDEILQDKNCYPIVLENENRIIGFAALIIHSVPSKGRVARVEDVVVSNDFRGQGLGEVLFDRLIEIAREKGIKNISLTSNPKRTAARSLYLKKGFILLDTGVFQLNVG